MKTKLFRIFLYILGFIVIPHLYVEGEPRYQFSTDTPIVYNFNIKGDITYQYEGISSEKFNVYSAGTITLKTIGKKEDIFIVKVIPSKTVIKLNDEILEDLTNSETAISQMISTSVIEIKSDGKIMNSKELNSGILDVSQILMLLPAFPENLNRPWKQTIPTFSIPGIPMCSLTFTYSYSQGKDGISKIKLLSNQPIKEERKEKEVVISFTGKNTSSGEFVFDEGKGEINAFDGSFDLIMNIVFKVPPSPEQKTSTKQGIPLKIGIKLTVKIN